MKVYLNHLNRTAQSLTGACNNILNAEATIARSLQTVTLANATKQSRFVLESLDKGMKEANAEIDYNVTRAKKAVAKLKIELDLIEEELNERLPKENRTIIDEFVDRIGFDED